MAKKAKSTKKIDINCDYTELVPLIQLIPFQLDLKDLSNSNYTKLKNSIIEHGFIDAIVLFERINDDGTTEKTKLIIDGHQRRRCLLRMAEEHNLTMPEGIPVTYVRANTEKEATNICSSNSM